MKSFTQLQQETSAVQLDFLLTDVSAANTFLDVAGTTRDKATRNRNVQHAQEAYAMVCRMSDRVQKTAEQDAELQDRLDLLKARIDGMNLA